MTTQIYVSRSSSGGSNSETFTHTINAYLQLLEADVMMEPARDQARGAILFTFFVNRSPAHGRHHLTTSALAGTSAASRVYSCGSVPRSVMEELKWIGDLPVPRRRCFSRIKKDVVCEVQG
ncbi:hypothetical protein BgiMline_018671 [Biomphalaria glabrata]